MIASLISVIDWVLYLNLYKKEKVLLFGTRANIWSLMQKTKLSFKDKTSAQEQTEQTSDTRATEQCAKYQ